MSEQASHWFYVDITLLSETKCISLLCIVTGLISVSVTSVETPDAEDYDSSPFSPRVSSLVGKYSNIDSPTTPTSPKVLKSRHTENELVKTSLNGVDAGQPAMLNKIQPVEEPVTEKIQSLGNSTSLQNGDINGEPIRLVTSSI